jgi:hypothetical protein
MKSVHKTAAIGSVFWVAHKVRQKDGLLSRMIPSTQEYLRFNHRH